MKISIPFVPTSGAQSPNSKSKNVEEASASYYRAIVVALASLRRWNPSVELELVSPGAPPPRILRELDEIGAALRFVAFAHQPPVGFAKKFGASLYLLDAISSDEHAGGVAYVDPDVVCVRSLSNSLQFMPGPSALDIGTASHINVNGLTVQDAAAEATALFGSRQNYRFRHLGGEFLWLQGRARDEIRPLMEECWRYALERFESGNPHFVTEEHMLSAVATVYRVEPAGGVIRRIWTTGRVRTVTGEEESIPLWHLPAEKDRGFRPLYEAAVDSGSWFWNSSPAAFVHQSSRHLGVRHRTIRRMARDVAGQVYGYVRPRHDASI